MPLAQLPPSTVKLIGSSQVITSVSSVIKELMENSIDSGATHIEIKLEKHGLEKIEVKDDGCGIGKSDVLVMCLPSFTSKILDFSDLDNLSSYGFRGEALSSLCNVANVSITTKTEDDEFASCYTYDQNGQVVGSKISHITKGTIVTVSDLFKKLPVRKQFVSSSKRAAEELKRVEKIVKSLAMVHPRLRVTLVHNKFLIWQKSSVIGLRQSVMQVLSLSTVKQLHHILHNTQQIRVEMLVPRRDCDVASICISNFSDAYFLFINNRPVRMKNVEKLVYNRFSEYFGVYLPVNKYPMCVTCLTLPSDCVDVNLEPNKTRIYFKDEDDVLDIIKQCMHLYYGDQSREAEDKAPITKSGKKRKLEGDCLEFDSKKVILDECKTANGEEFVDQNGIYSRPNMSVEDGNPTEVHLSEDIPDSMESSEQVSSNPSPRPSQEELDSMFQTFCLERSEKLKEVPETKSSTSEQISAAQTEIKCSTLQDTDTKRSTVKSPVLSTFFEINQTCQTENHNNHVKNGNLIVTHQSNSREKNEDFSVLTKSMEISSSTANKENEDEYLFSSYGNQMYNQNSSNANSSEDYQEEVFIPAEQKKPSLGCNGDDAKIRLCSPTLSQWSRGEVTTPAGTLIKGSSVATILPSSTSSPSFSSQTLSNRSVSSQMGCKEMSAFTKFARSMRKKILEDQPDMSFTRVAQQLQTQWRDLDTDEKRKYEEVANKKISPLKPGEKQKTLFSFLNRKPYIELELDINTLQQTMREPREEVEEDGARVIGRLESSPVWFYRLGSSDLLALSAHRLREAVRFHHHLSSFSLPIILLDNFIPFSSSDIRDKEWRLLLDLERSPNGVVKDNRLVSNGLFLEILEGDLEARLTHVPQNISHCGVEEVQEVLRLILTHGPYAPLSQCRPLRVISFLRSEVMRECSQEESPSQLEEVSELLTFWLKHIAPQTLLCIHHLPVSNALDTIY